MCIIGGGIYFTMFQHILKSLKGFELEFQNTGVEILEFLILT